MQVVANTPFEAALAQRQAAGAVTSGNSAGAAVESADMIAGYTGSNGPEQGLEQGAVDVWTYDGPTDDTRGPDLRPPGRPARPARPPARPDRAADQRLVQRAGELGLGVDANTAATIENGTHLTEIGGHVGRVRRRFADLRRDRASSTPRGRSRSTTSRPTSCRPATATTSTHASRSSAASPSPAPTSPVAHSRASPRRPGAGRSCSAAAPPSAGRPQPPRGRLGRRPAARSSSSPPATRKRRLATKDAKAFAASLARWRRQRDLVRRRREDQDGRLVAALGGADGRPPRPHRTRRPCSRACRAGSGDDAAIHDAWPSGAALLANDAAASAISAGVHLRRPTRATRPARSKSAASPSSCPPASTPVAGLGWVGVAVEPGIVSNRHWGRLYNLLARQARGRSGRSRHRRGHRGRVRRRARAPSSSATAPPSSWTADYGSFGVGTNGALAAHWVILDTFVGGQSIAP